MLLLEQQIPQGTEKVRARGGKSRGRGLGAGSAPPSAVLPSGLELSVQNPSLPGINRKNSNYQTPLCDLLDQIFGTGAYDSVF